MQYRTIPGTDVKVSAVSLGCWTMGGLNWVDGIPNGWADVDEEEITRSIRLAVDSGVNHFDNADVYGNGRAERMLARVFRRLGLRSEDYIISSKVGHFRGTATHAYEPAHIRHQCEQSLINLERDYLDIYYFHHGDFGEGDRYLEAAVETFDALVREGKVRIKGQSAYSVADFEKSVPWVQPRVLQSWGHALDDQFIRPGFPLSRLMEKHDLGFVAFSPLAQGRLLDKYDPEKPPVFEPGDHRRNKPGFGADELAKLKPALEKIKSRFGGSVEDLASVALNFVLAHPRVVCAIPGFRNQRQVSCNLAAIGRDLGEEDVAFIREALS